MKSNITKWTKYGTTQTPRFVRELSKNPAMTLKELHSSPTEPVQISTMSSAFHRYGLF